MSNKPTGPLSESVLDSSPIVFELDSSARDQRPEQVGSYRILELLGEGGMGEVYKAERREPIRQTVALKVVKLGMNSREIVGRFESERQALALMDHPGIARVLDAGTTITGRPYFVMDFVAGKPITVFCDEQRLSIPERLRLFAQVCEAIGHAHTKAIIHRDIKPSNVLAYHQDGAAAVKVIDFGIAKALTGDRLTDVTVNTGAGRAIGTYECMSPEQVEGSPDIDTRTDVYSLGVLLYELLTGAKPFDHETLAGTTDAELRRVIREVDPPRPSTRLSGLGAQGAALADRRRARVDELARQLRSELEWIPLKAMRKERGRRYASPAQLAHDVRNYLDGKPLLAGPETRSYRARKFAGRHRAGVLATAAVVAASVAGATFYVRGIRAEQRKTQAALVEAQYQKGAATREKDVASAVSGFLTERVLSGIGSELIAEKAVRDAIVKAMLDPAAAAVEADFKDKPIAQAAVRASLAETYITIGRADLGLPQAQASLALRHAHLGDDDLTTVQSIASVGEALRIEGLHVESEPYFREAFERCRRVLGPDDSSTLGQMNNLAAALYFQERFGEALPLLREAIDRGRRSLGLEDPEVLRWTINLGGFLTEAGELDEAERVLVAALGPSRRVWGDDSPNSLNLMTNLGRVQTALGKSAAAEPLLREAWQALERRFGPDHPQTLGTLNALALNVEAQGKLDEAESLLRAQLAARRRTLGDDAPITLNAMNALGGLLLDAKKFDEAAAVLRESMERGRRVAGDQAWGTIVSMVNLTSALSQSGRRDEALTLLGDAAARAKADPTLGVAHKNTRQLADALAQILTDAGQTDAAAATRSEFGLPAESTGSSASTAPATQRGDPAATTRR